MALLSTRPVSIQDNAAARQDARHPAAMHESSAALSPAFRSTPALLLPALQTPRWIYLKLTTVALIWGGTFIAGHLLAQSLSPLLAATARFAVAACLLLIWAYKTEGGLPRLNGQQLLVTLALGATGIFFYNLCFFTALSSLPAGRTALLVALNPIVTALLLGLLFKERLGLVRWCGIALAFIGAAIIVSRGELTAALQDLSGTFGQGELYMLCAVLSWAAYTIIGRNALRGLSALAATTYAALWGLVLLSAALLVEQVMLDPLNSGPMLIAPLSSQLQTLSLEAIAAIIYLGGFGTVLGFVWYYQGVKAIGPSRTAIFTNLVPVFGVLLATLLLDEPLLLSMLLGGLLVIGGVMLTNRCTTATTIPSTTTVKVD